MMRHLVEVMMVVEGRETWARRVAEGRREQGLALPLVEVVGDEDGMDALERRLLGVSLGNDVLGDESSVGRLMTRLLGMNKDVVRCIVSFL